MFFVLNLIGLNFMLILLTSGYLALAYGIYVVWIVGAIMFALNSFYVYNQIHTGGIEAPQELQFLPMDLPQQIVLNTACNTAISTVLVFFMLNSVFIPVLMLTLLVIRCFAAKEANKVMKCLK